MVTEKNRIVYHNYSILFNNIYVNKPLSINQWAWASLDTSRTDNIYSSTIREPVYEFDFTQQIITWRVVYADLTYIGSSGGLLCQYYNFWMRNNGTQVRLIPYNKDMGFRYTESIINHFYIIQVGYN